MLILSRVCADFHDARGNLLFSIRPPQRLTFVEAPDAIREDPLFQMLVNEGSLEASPAGIDPTTPAAVPSSTPADVTPAVPSASAPEAAASSTPESPSAPSAASSASAPSAPSAPAKSTRTRTKSTVTDPESAPGDP